MKKVKSIKDLQQLMESLGAEKEAGDGFTSWTLECGPKPQATSRELVESGLNLAIVMV